MIIYLIVGGRIRKAEGRIAGRIAVVRTEYGDREFGTFYTCEEDARVALEARKRRRRLDIAYEADV